MIAYKGGRIVDTLSQAGTGMAGVGKEKRDGPRALEREWLHKNKKYYERSQYVIENKERLSETNSKRTPN
jgi:hypothetical protein